VLARIDNSKYHNPHTREATGAAQRLPADDRIERRLVFIGQRRVCQNRRHQFIYRAEVAHDAGDCLGLSHSIAALASERFCRCPAIGEPVAINSASRLDENRLLAVASSWVRGSAACAVKASVVGELLATADVVLSSSNPLDRASLAVFSA
jgi:hypothetical protein